MDRLTIEVTDSPAAEDLDIIGRQLTAFNDADVDPSERRPLAVVMRDDDGAILAGLSGYTAWGWLYVQWLWVAESRRGQGLAARLLAMAETEALARQCHGAHIDTFSPHALKVYQRAGYKVFGVLPDFPKGRTRSFLSKPLGDITL
ncbi:GNAT family N-acetyltransferase [Devosia faecipullorum]|uniref:GNAT family N-acetyltransferase n=1 Tax=Devosia faecipullorum TaxID=2755039 RepID=UPI00187B9B0E|nr:GNAT family N-acetyltransferase [Devosia faecipullorum]MBE7734130.1 GNAT family N-acetyltransferase [Devosia faecipullorum]